MDNENPCNIWKKKTEPHLNKTELNTSQYTEVYYFGRDTS